MDVPKHTVNTRPAWLLGLCLCISSYSQAAIVDKQTSTASSSASPTLQVGQKNYRAGEILVKFTENASVSRERMRRGRTLQKFASMGEYSMRQVGKLRNKHKRVSPALASAVNRWHIVKLPPGISVEDALLEFQADSDVEAVEPNYILSIDAIPNDPRFPEMWALDNTGQTGGTPDADIDAPEAWDMITATNEVIVAVIDTGIDYNHPELVNNLWVNPGEIADNNIDDDGNGYIDDVIGYDFVGLDGTPWDDHGHGTHVSGTIAAAANNGMGITGINDSARIMSIKFLDFTGTGGVGSAIAAINYATDMGAQIMNNSWGGGSYYQSLADAIAAANDANALFVAAAGNAAADNDHFAHYPSSYDVPNVISVAASDHNDALAYFSNYGKISVDLAAPGENVLSTVTQLASNVCALCDPSGYMVLSGTSMAAPHVSGAAALLLSNAPNLTVPELKTLLLDTVDTPTALAGTSLTDGRLNLHEAAKNITYRISANPSPQSVDQGATTTGTLNIEAFDNFSGPLTLSVQSAEPLLSVTLDASEVNPTPGNTANVNVTVTADASLHAGTYSYTVTATDPNAFQRTLEVAVNVTGPNFAVSLTPASQNVTPGDSGVFTVQLDSIEGMDLPITLDFQINEPSITGAFATNPVPLIPDSSTTTTLTAATTTTTPVGNHEFTVLASDGEVTYTTTGKVNVPMVFEVAASNLILPSQIGVGGKYDITFTATSNSNVSSTYTWSVYLSADPIITPYDQLLPNSSSTVRLEAGESATVTQQLTLPPDVSLGTTYMGVFLGNFDSVDDNGVSSSVDIVSYDADATVTDVTADATTLPVNNALTLTATVDNLGGNDMSNVSVNFYLSTDSTIDASDYLVGSSTLPWPLPGLSSAPTSVTGTASVAPGQYYIGAIVDPDNTISESNETNNVTAGATVDVTGGMDLIVSSLTAPSQGSPGANLAIDFTGTNQGSDDVNGYIWWAIYLSTDDVIDASDQLLHQANWTEAITTLPAGQSNNVSKNVSLPTELAAGDYYIGVFIDHWGGYAEINETNNTAASLIQVTVP